MGPKGEAQFLYPREAGWARGIGGRTGARRGQWCQWHKVSGRPQGARQGSGDADPSAQLLHSAPFYLFK
jgi:hypothetical protein